MLYAVVHLLCYSLKSRCFLYRVVLVYTTRPHIVSQS